LTVLYPYYDPIQHNVDVSCESYLQTNQSTTNPTFIALGMIIVLHGEIPTIAHLRKYCHLIFSHVICGPVAGRELYVHCSPFVAIFISRTGDSDMTPNCQWTVHDCPIYQMPGYLKIKWLT